MEYLLKAAYCQRKRGHYQGFTLIELLIVVLIAGGIISGLMFMVVELLTADQKEASKTQTQQEMQMSLDYISAELRQAVFIYDETCLSSTVGAAERDENALGFCPELKRHLPSTLTDSDTTPILAFWKQKPLRKIVRDQCATGSAIAGTPCIAGHAYSLVVYSMDTSESEKWEGQARITRYALDKYTVSGNSYRETPGYVDPGAYGNTFKSWPFYQEIRDVTRVNKQQERPTGNADVLVDFVDHNARDTVSCPPDYRFSAPKTEITGFYACVSVDDATSNNRDVILSLRGNAYGRPAIRGRTAYLPMLETHVLSRPVFDKPTVID